MYGADVAKLAFKNRGLNRLAFVVLTLSQVFFLDACDEKLELFLRGGLHIKQSRNKQLSRETSVR
jgi:hypothetical protein